MKYFCKSLFYETFKQDFIPLKLTYFDAMINKKTFLDFTLCQLRNKRAHNAILSQ